MASSILSLSIDTGPKKGETLDINPGALIHIGRVVRGNTLAIKEPSISQKHLSVQFLPEINRWAVTDLGSSNGTFVNGAFIPPDDPVPLAYGDIIRVGEQTAISVRISVPEADPAPQRRCRRPPRSAKAVSSEEEKMGEPAKNGGKGRVRGRKIRGSSGISRKNDVLEAAAVLERRVTRAGTTRVPRKKVKEEEKAVAISDSNSGEVAEKEKPCEESNAGRGSAGISRENDALEVAVLERRVTRAGTTWVSRKKVKEEEKFVVISDSDSGEVAEKEKGFEGEEPNAGGEKEDRAEEVEDDMDSMTLGEWFDRMEKYIPMAVNKVAEEIIKDLRNKAQLLDEYVTQTTEV